MHLFMAGEHIGVEYLVQQTSTIQLPDQESPEFEEQLEGDEALGEQDTPASPTPSEELELEGMAPLPPPSDEDSAPDDDPDVAEVCFQH